MTNTSTAIAVSNQEAQALLNAMASGDVGISNKSGGLPFPTLKIIQENDKVTDTEEALEIPFGSFNLQGTNLVAKEVVFQPLASFYKVIRQGDSDDNYRVQGETVFFKDWSDEQIDSLGGVGCGRLFGKNAKQLNTDEAKANQDKGKLFMYVFGMVTFPDAEPQLCLFRLSGGKMVRWTDATNRKVINSNINERTYKLSTISPKKDPRLTKQQQQESRGTYVNLIVEPNMDSLVSSGAFYDELVQVANYVAESNVEIRNQHDRARQSSIGDDYIDGEIIDLEIEELE